MSKPGLEPARPISRRSFIRMGSAGSIAAAGARFLPPGLAALLASAQAQAAEALGEAALATLTRMARDVFPHARFDDGLYRSAVAGYGPQMAKDKGLKKLLAEGVASLDATARKLSGKAYGAIAEEAERLKVLQAVESSAFFKKVRGDLVVSLYNQPALWAKLGYQGPSADQGGYLNRGFNDQTWMDQA